MYQLLFLYERSYNKQNVKHVEYYKFYSPMKLSKIQSEHVLPYMEILRKNLLIKNTDS